jgi:hypothetical protein
MVDRDRLPDSYDAWLKIAEQAERNITRGGGIAVRAIIDPKNFGAWCLLHGLNVDAGARIAFAAEFARLRFGQNH